MAASEESQAFAEKLNPLATRVKNVEVELLEVRDVRLSRKKSRHSRKTRQPLSRHVEHRSKSQSSTKLRLQSRKSSIESDENAMHDVVKAHYTRGRINRRTQRNPSWAFALQITSRGDCRAQLVEHLVGISKNGREFVGWTNRSPHWHVCPEFEAQYGNQEIVYFGEDANAENQFAKLCGTLALARVSTDEVRFDKILRGEKKKTKLGEYEIMNVVTSGRTQVVTVRTPLPESMRGTVPFDLGHAKHTSLEEARWRAAGREVAQFVTAQFVGSDGKSYAAPQSKNGTLVQARQAQRAGHRFEANSRLTKGADAFTLRAATDNVPVGVSLKSFVVRVLDFSREIEHVDFELLDVRLR